MNTTKVTKKDDQVNRCVEERLQMVIYYVKEGAKELDAGPFNKRALQEYLGKQGAAIVVLADTLQELLAKVSD